uniref:EF-hand domain-containing protein n=1 Tax=Elaeophora elaphi TaxID=1147741 RepID=A0A0R3RMB7_9BILA
MKLFVVFLITVEIFCGKTKSETIAAIAPPSSMSVPNAHVSLVPVEITPIPADDFSPRFDEFRRIDANGDHQITFAEFILADRPYIEDKSRLYHRQDLNGDGIVSKNEFASYYRKKEERRLREQQAENFFKQLEVPFTQPFSFGFPQNPFFPSNSRTVHDLMRNTSSPESPSSKESVNGTLQFFDNFICEI